MKEKTARQLEWPPNAFVIIDLRTTNIKTQQPNKFLVMFLNVNAKCFIMFLFMEVLISNVSANTLIKYIISHRAKEVVKIKSVLAITLVLLGVVLVCLSLTSTK